MVGARIGKRFVLFMSSAVVLSFCVVQAVHADAPQLLMVSDQGQPITTISAGYPCMIELTLPASIALQKKPMIEGIDPEHILREQETTQMYVVNGKAVKQRTISYVISFSDIGTVTVGPAHLYTDTGELIVPATAIEVTDPATVKTNAKKVVFARLQVHKEQAYVHEAVPYTIQFCYTTDAVNQIALQPWSVHQATVEELDTVQRGTTTVQGNTYNVATWSGVLYPNKDGRIMLPSVAFEYTEPVLSSHMQHHWAQFMQMFAPVSVHKQLRTNSVTLTVLPLPETEHAVTGVGTLSDIQLRCSADTVKQGESVVCTVTFEGTFDAAAFQAPSLVVPDTMRVFESKVTTTGTYPRITKQYEYIVQCRAAGALEIPAQEYYLFDPRSELYRPVRTAPYKLYSMPTVQLPEPTTLAGDDTGTSEPTVTEPETKSPASDHSVVSLVLPLWLYLVLLTLPAVWVCTRKYLYHIHARMQQRRMRKKAFQYLQRATQNAGAQTDSAPLLDAWRNFLRMVVPAQALQQDPSGAAYLQSLGASEAELHLWNKLSHDCAAYTFYKADTSNLRTLVGQIDACSELLRTHLRKKGLL